MKITRWFFCSLLFVTVNLAYADEIVTESKISSADSKVEVAEVSEKEKASETVAADDTEEETAQTLHAEKCIACHTRISADRGDGNPFWIYTRDDHRVKNQDRLNKHVQFCVDNLNIAWFEDEVTDVINYLNTEYYKFDTDE
ncbi:hypothetical protein [Candidatus Parabeggiatoa sp. HSG14]|uniref:hypothetical protein n=1 Tax=Candidatus Parabeggiatoa sp. HSG14 TaxID=3055593 RepID=UPI0025A91045|nr:hypothetical protein [Thiotrichales bacterium HSG14]